MNRRFVTVVAMMLSVAGCGSATPTSPTTSSTTTSVVSPAGTWSGSISDPISGDGAMQLALSQTTPSALTGTWSATFKNGDSFSGPAVAELSLPTGYGITLILTQQPPCTSTSGPGASAAEGFTLLNVVVTSSRLTATSGRISCNGLTFGTVALSTQ